MWRCLPSNVAQPHKGDDGKHCLPADYTRLKPSLLTNHTNLIGSFFVIQELNSEHGGLLTWVYPRLSVSLTSLIRLLLVVSAGPTVPPPYSLEAPSSSNLTTRSSTTAISEPPTPGAPVVFHGLDADECRKFIQDVRRHAFEQELDDARTATFALTCFQGAALDWQLDLEDEVNESWKLLQKALKEKFLAAPTSSRPSGLSSR